MSAADRFFQAFVRPFAKNPQAVEEARRLFGHRLELMDGHRLDADTIRLEQTGFTKRWPKGVVALLLLSLFIVWVTEAFAMARGPVVLWKMISTLSGESPVVFPLDALAAASLKDDDAPRRRVGERLGKNLPARERAWLFGSDLERLAAAEERWREHPEDPARYLDLVRMRKINGQSLPADFVEIGSRIDPDNGWFALAAGAARLNGAIQWEGSAAGKSKVIKIHDQGQFDAGLSLIGIAASKPVCRNYRAEMLAVRFGSTAVPTDAFEQVGRIFLVYDGAESISIPAVGRSLEEQFKRFAGRNDKVGMARTVADWESIAKALTSMVSDDLSSVVAQAFIRKGGKALRNAAFAAGEVDLVARIEQVILSKPFLSSETGTAWDQEWMQDHGSSFASLGLGVTQRSAMVEEDFAPQRKIGQVILERVQAWQGMMILWLVGALAGSAIWRQPKASRVVSRRLMSLLLPRDKWWIIGMGIGLPAVLYLVVTRFTPMGCRDYSTVSFATHVFFAQAVAALFLAIILIVEVAYWRMSARSGYLVGGPVGFSVLRSILPILCCLCLVASGGVRWSGAEDAEIMAVISAVLAVGVMVRLGYLFGDKSETRVFHLAVMRAALPAFLFGALLLTATIPFSIRAERHWVKQDPLFDADPRYNGHGRSQQEDVQRTKRLLTEALESK